MPDTDRNTVEVPLLDMFQNLTKQIDALDKRVVDAIEKIARQIAADHGSLTARMDAFENWRIRHEAGDGHPAISAELKATDKRLDLLEQEAREQQARDKTLAEDQRAREDARDKRANRRTAVLTVAFTAALVLVGLLGAFAPALLGR